MICEHLQNENGNKCFVPINAWDEPCNDCPCPQKVKEYMKTPKAKQIYVRAKKLLDRIEKEMLYKEKII